MAKPPKIVAVRGTSKHRRSFPDFALLATEHSPGSKLERHRHESAFFTVVIRGEYQESWQRTTSLCKAQSVRYLAPGEAHSNEFGEGSLCLNVELFPHYCAKIEEAFRGSKSGEIRHATARNIGRRLWMDFNLSDNLTEFATLAAIFDLAGTSKSVKRGQYISPPRWLENVREYLEANCTSSLRLTNLAEATSHHPVHVSREFRRYYGRTLVDFLRERRVVGALEMLNYSEWSIAEISLRCGFYDQSHFTNVFRRHLRCTPAHYRMSRSLSDPRAVA